MNIGENLIKARKAKGLSQEDVAQELNVSRQSVSLWETDQTVPTIDNLVTLSKLYGVNVSILLGQDEEESKDSKNANTYSYDSSSDEVEEYRRKLAIINEHEAMAQKEKYLEERRLHRLKSYKQLIVIAFISLILAILNPDYSTLVIILSLLSLGCSLGAKDIKKNNLTLFLLVLSIFYLVYGIISLNLNLI